MSEPPYSESFERRLDGLALARRMARHWRGSVLVTLAIGGIVVGIVQQFPESYESSASIEVTTQPGAPPIVASNVLAEITRILAERAVPGAPNPVISSVAGRTFSIAMRDGSAEGARSAAKDASLLVVARLSAITASPAQVARERATKALSDFVTEHPDVFLEGASAATGSASPSASRQPPPDAALTLLRQEKARLEATLAKARSDAETGAAHEANPYDDSDERPRLAELERHIAEVRQAILQSTVAHKAPTAPSSRPVVTPVAPNRAAMLAERETLVRAAMDAARAADAAPASARSAKIVTPASLPRSPVSPSVWVRRVLPIALGVWSGILWAVARVAQRQSRVQRAKVRRASLRPTPQARPQPARIEEATPKTSSVSTVPPKRGTGPELPLPPIATTFSAPTTERVPPIAEPPELVVPAPPAQEGSAAARAETKLGMMDPALLRTQIGGTPADLLSRTGVLPADAGARGKTQRVNNTVTNAATAPGFAASTPPPPNVPEPASEPPRRIKMPSTHPSRAGERASSNPPRVAARPASDAPVLDTRGERVSSSPPRPVAPVGGPIAEKRRDGPGTMGSTAESPFAPPATRRYGTADPKDSKTLSPPPPPPSNPPRRASTSYSFVDQSRRSRPPSVQPRPAVRDPNPPSVFDDVPPPAPPPAPRVASNAPPADANRRDSYRPAAGRDPKTGQEVWTTTDGAASNGSELIAPRSVPASWRLRPVLDAGPAQEVLRVLTDQIREHSSRKCFVVAVVGDYSVLEAKSTIAGRISTMLSADGRRRVLLLEANFDFPAVHRILALEMPFGTGFSQQLRARIRSGTRSPWNVVRCSDTFHVLAEGVVRSPGILLSREFSEAMTELRGAYDVIVMDGPIAGLGVETKPIDAVCDGIAVIAPTGVTLADTLETARGWFGRKELFAAVPAGGAA